MCLYMIITYFTIGFVGVETFSLTIRVHKEVDTEASWNRLKRDELDVERNVV
jgi:hypothetical protein